MSSKEDTKEGMRIEEQVLDEGVYKRNPLYQHKGKGRIKNPRKDNSRSKPLSLKHVSYTADQYPYP